MSRASTVTTEASETSATIYKQKTQYLIDEILEKPEYTKSELTLLAAALTVCKLLNTNSSGLDTELEGLQHFINIASQTKNPHYITMAEQKYEHINYVLSEMQARATQMSPDELEEYNIAIRKMPVLREQLTTAAETIGSKVTSSTSRRQDWKPSGEQTERASINRQPYVRHR